ncbi:hypothetical protein ACLOJK_023165 [Asimina triloba]
MQARRRVLITNVLLSAAIFNAHADVLLESGRRAVSEGSVDAMEEAKEVKAVSTARQQGRVRRLSVPCGVAGFRVGPTSPA